MPLIDYSSSVNVRTPKCVSITKTQNIVKWEMPKKQFLLILAIWSIFSSCTQPGPADQQWPWSKSGPTPTPTKTPAPLIVVLPIPPLPPAVNSMKALNSSAARPAELASVRFITSDTLTYLQSGNLYTYELATNAKRLIVDGNAITTMDWSEKRQQFVFIKAKRLFLFDLANNTLLNLSDTLAKLSGHFTAPACDLSIASNENMSQQVNLLENVDAVQWTPDQSALIFRTSNFDHAVGSATGYTKVAKSFCCKASIICQRWPVLNPVSTVLNLPDDLRKGLDAYREWFDHRKFLPIWYKSCPSSCYFTINYCPGIFCQSICLAIMCQMRRANSHS